MDLGITIKELRKQKGIKQKDFASACSISPTYLCQIENNQREPNLSTLKEISKTLAIPLPIIFFLSLDENDIPEKKKDAYSILAPSIQSFLKEFFSNS